MLSERLGVEEPHWTTVGQDHYRHADAYAWIAEQLIQGQYSRELVTASVLPFSEKENIFTEDEIW